MKNILKIFTALLFALNMMPVSADTQQDMQKDIADLTAAFDAQIKNMQNSQNTSHETGDLENLSQNECEAEIEEMFKDGVPDEYTEEYNKYVKQRGDIKVDVINDSLHYCNYYIEGMTGKITCKGNHHFLKECERATEQISISVTHKVKELVKEAYCGTQHSRNLNNLVEDCGFTNKTAIK